MITKLFLMVVAVVIGAAALAQLRITSLDSSGQLKWTNTAAEAIYSVESAGSPTGPWNPLVTVADLDRTVTNRMSANVPLGGRQASFYPFAWLQPSPIGEWDYSSYDGQGSLTITGRLSMTSTNHVTTNPPGYAVEGSWNLQYAGPPTNTHWYLGPQIGSGTFLGAVNWYAARLILWWPTNCADCSIFIAGTLWPNTCTGQWTYVTLDGPQRGSFRLERR